MLNIYQLTMHYIVIRLIKIVIRYIYVFSNIKKKLESWARFLFSFLWEHDDLFTYDILISYMTCGGAFSTLRPTLGMISNNFFRVMIL